MKAKLIIGGDSWRQTVATFYSTIEALQCGSLLQASTEDKNLKYHVEIGKKKFEIDPFVKRIPFLNKQTKADLKNYFTGEEVETSQDEK
jgi:hypothetical protein